MKQNKDSPVRKISFIFVIFILVITGIFTWSFFQIRDSDIQEIRRREEIVALNEIKKLTEENGVSPAGEEIEELMNSISQEKTNIIWKEQKYLILLYGAGILFACSIFMYVYFIIVRPFQKLETYAGEIAKGNFDVRLSYERKNMFGAFTWAFDHMRGEIGKARICEKEAIENNKTVIATLSHDIKTPVASIRAYAEGLEAGMDSTLERKERYLKVIMRKCDEVTKLTDDLFLHSLSDLEKLQLKSETFYINELLQEIIDEMQGNKNDIHLIKELEPAVVNIDKRRMIQVIENIINNARKYAPGTPIDIWTENQENGSYEIHLKDFGGGISPEDMPFIFEKFYRGKNAGNMPGAGLGMYIVKYILDQMRGSVILKNWENGLEVILILSVK